MVLGAKQLEANIAWLLTYGSPAVRYLARRDLMGTPADSVAMRALWRQVEACGEAREIFGKQEGDGSWCAGGSWALKPSYVPKDGRDPYSPKYVTTVWVLPLLGEMGFTVEDPRIRKACEYILSHGYFLHPAFRDPATSVSYEENDISPCRFSQYLIALSSVGWGDDYRVKRAYEFLLHGQRDDGGWALEQHFRERNWTRSCPFSSYHAATALYCSGNEAYRGALIKGLNFLVWHLSTKSDDEIRRFFYHGHSTVRELRMLSALQVGLHEQAVQTILEWLMTMYCPDDGCFKYTGKPVSRYSRRKDGMDSRVAKYRLYHLIESDWFTYHMTSIGVELNR